VHEETTGVEEKRVQKSLFFLDLLVVGINGPSITISFHFEEFEAIASCIPTFASAPHQKIIIPKTSFLKYSGKSGAVVTAE